MQHAWRAGAVSVRYDLKPDRLAGQRILRPVPAGPEVAGVKIPSSTIVFEPQRLSQSPPPVISLEEQTARARATLVEIAERAESENPVALTLVRFKTRFTRTLAAALFRASWIERERIKCWLSANGHSLAAHTLESMPLPRPYVPAPSK
jgi:hypothetical protein